jgi:hippurate hydrolase
MLEPAADPLDFVRQRLENLTALRRDLHRHPELGFEEHRTAARIAAELQSVGIRVTPGIGGTGLVGIIEGTGGPGRSIGLRADMDALPIDEQTNLPWRSTVPGRFHGCGHDGHIAMLLAAAFFLQAHRDFAGRIVLIFQPAEEGLGGARAMLADGLFGRFACDEVYAIHNAPDRPLGTYAVAPGPVMASADFFDILIQGKGGHAAFPQRTVDAGVVAVAIAQALQSIVSRNVDPIAQAVLSITTIEAGATYNVIPDTAKLAGTVRTLSPEVRRHMADRIRRLARGIADGFEADVTVDIRDVFGVLVNHEEQALAMGDAAEVLVGAGNVDRAPPLAMTSEDFADMLDAVPGAYCFVGQGLGPALHNPRYAFNDDAIPFGAAMLARIALDRLSASRPV